MGGKSQTSTTNSSQSYTPAALQQLQDIYSKAASAASTPYTPYTGQLTAGLTDTQQQGINNVNAAANSAQPYFNQAADYARQGASTITPQQIQQYQNPYTQSVINATQKQFDEQNGQQQQQVLGNAASQGALGGDRSAVLQALTAGQQQMAQAPVIAGLQSQGYQQALQAAQADRSAAQTGASQFAGIGTGAQSAALQGAGAQLQAGGIEQGTNQNDLNAQYQQFLTQQAYPFQTAQFLASIGVPVAGAMGGTTTGQGTQTSPGPNPWTQIAGLGLSAASMFSDKRVKDGVEKIGETYDGQPIYRFRYKGEPTVRIGLMAQDVEKKTPKAVGKSRGIKTVNYDIATEKAAKKGHFADGGAVGGSPFNIIDASGYVPKPVAISGGSAPQPGGMSMPGASNDAAKQDAASLDSISKGLGGLKGLFSGDSYGGGNIFNSEWGGSSSSPLEGLTAADYGVGFASGGAVSPFADDGGLGDRFAAVEEAIKDGTFDPQGNNYTPFTYREEPPAAPIPAAAPAQPAAQSPRPVASATPPASVELPPQITNPDGESATPAMAFSNPSAASPMAAAASQDAPANTMGGWNPFNLSDKTRQSLIAAGLGMAASRSPFALSAIGEGGLTGVKTYGQLTAAEKEAADKKIAQAQNQRRIDMEAQRIEQSAQQFAKNYDLSNRRLQKDLDKVPEGYRATKDGSYEPIPGGPADPAQVEKVARAKRPAGAEMDDETADFLADRVLIGDTRALVGLGRGAQGAENIAKIQRLVAMKAKSQGIDPTDILAKVAEQSGNMASQRTFGTNVARMAVNATEAQGAIELGRTASAAVPRTNWVPVNRAIQAYQSGTSDPALAKFGAANLAIINTYARAISPTGNPTVNDKQHAEHLLSTATGPDAYNAILDQMNEEIKIAHAAPLKAKKEMENIRKGRTSDHGESSAKAPEVGSVKDGYKFKGGDPSKKENWEKV